jgi:methanogenic corrinoid protein MtbC1/DNA-binding XRE family transcriptional regulator
VPDFATRLKELRVRRGLRQKDLAVALGLAQTTIANYEQKLRFPDEPMLVKIADFFDVSLDQLLGRTQDGGAAMGASGDIPLHGPALAYLEALRGNGQRVARLVLQEAVEAGATIGRIYLQVITPALIEVGRLWAVGEMSVGDEHAFSEATLQLMAELPREPSAMRRASCVVFAVSGESHVIGARMVADCLFLEGFKVSFPGGNLSISQSLEILRAEPVSLLALSVTLAEHLNAAEDMIRAIRADRQCARIRVLAGGQAFGGAPYASAKIGADAYAADAVEAVKVALSVTEVAD